jgi:hypothetical protein
METQMNAKSYKAGQATRAAVTGTVGTGVCAAVACGVAITSFFKGVFTAPKEPSAATPKAKPAAKAARTTKKPPASK